jgi:tRNA-specific 2-thiouridylase
VKVLAAMSGGVDSSVAAALLVEEGHDVTGVTLRLWDNATDAGCCSVAEIDDARRVAHVLGIDHLVWTFTEEFDARVVAPYAAAHAEGLTPNPCIECNRHLKFGRLLRRARQLGFDAVATGHHARIIEGRLLRGADQLKDQSYVLYVLGQPELTQCRFPVGVMTKAEVRAKAAVLGLPTADKPDSQDVCFVTTSGGREALLSSRIPLHPGRVVDAAGADVGHVDALELVTVGQRRGLGTGGGAKRYAISVDTTTRTVVVGDAGDLLSQSVRLTQLCWVRAPVEGPVEVQTSAHGDAVAGTFDGTTVTFAEPQRRVAPGQSVVLYRGDEVLGGGIAVNSPSRRAAPSG